MTELSETTVVITTFNHARFLDDAIKSVMAQTVRASEIIVVDDGSTDNPGAVVAQYNDVHLIRQQNAGLASARNCGLAAAAGTYIAFLDADDRLHPRMIEANLAQLAQCPDCALVYGGFDWIDEAGDQLNSVPVRRPGQDVYADFLTGNLIGMHATVLYRRDILQATGGFDASLRAAEDYDVFLRLAQNHPIAATSESLAEYRRHKTNMSNDFPYMLERVLSVLRRHKELASTRPDWLAAYREGVRSWKDYYCGLQLRQMRRSVKSMTNLGSEMGQTVRMLAVSPDGMAFRSFTAVKRWAGRQTRARTVRFGSLDRTTPLSQSFGYDRGKPVDRHFIEKFLQTHANDIRGRVLEIGDNEYTLRYGADRVEFSDVLNRYPGHPLTTFVGDLASGAGLPSNTFDCIILTQTLHLVFDFRAATATLHRILKPGGVLLVTVPWASPIDRGEWGDSWFWAISPKGLQAILDESFEANGITVVPYGNVKVATAFLYGLAEEELPAADFDFDDPHCPVIVAGRAVKARAVV